MSLIPRSSLFDFSDIFDHFHAPASGDTSKSNLFSPRVDVEEHNDKYKIIADLPGVDKDKLIVTLEDGVLTIDASTSEESTEKEGGHVIRKERRSGRYMRSFTLGNNIQKSDINAEFKDGVLTLEAPKSKTVATESKKIEIR